MYFSVYKHLRIGVWNKFPAGEIPVPAIILYFRYQGA